MSDHAASPVSQTGAPAASTRHAPARWRGNRRGRALMAVLAPAEEAAVQAGTDVFARALHAVARCPTRIQHVARTRYMVPCYTTMVRSLRVSFVSPSGLGNL